MNSLENKYHYIYKTKLPDGRFYIGYHYGKLNDKYFGSNKEVKLLTKQNKYFGFIKCILSIHQSERAARLEERNQTNLVNAANNPQYLNLIKGGCGCILAGKTYEEVYGLEKALELKKIRAEATKNRIISNETRLAISKGHKGLPAWNKGLKFLDDPKFKGGRKNKGNIAWNKNLTGEEYKSRFKKDTALKPPSMLGYKWINDGTNQTKLAPTQDMPEGWYFGRLDLRGDKNPMRNKEVAKRNSELRKKNYENKKNN